MRRPNCVFLWLLVLIFSIQLNAQTSKYGNVSMGGGGFVSGLIMSKTQQNLLYARTDVGGAYRWDATNAKWIPLLDWVSESQTGYLGVESMATDPQAPNKLYMLVGISYFNSGATAILRSSDYGETFTITDVTSQFKAHGNGMGRQNGEKLQVDPHNSNILFCGTRWNGLFKSTDAGATWSKVSALSVTTTANENGISFVVLDGSSVSGGVTQRMFVGVSQTGTNLYRSNDGGATFTAISGAPTDLMPQRAILDDAGNLYITYGNGAGPHGHWALPEPFDLGAIWKYNLSTGAWTNVTPSGFTRPFGGLSVDPNNPNRIVASTMNTWLIQEDEAYGDRFLITTDGGTTWTDVIARGFDMDPNGADWITGKAIHWTGSIEFDPFNTKKVWVTSGNGIFSTDDIDATTNVWKFTVKGLEETVPYGCVSIPNGPVVSAVADYDGFVNSDITAFGAVHQPQMGSTSDIAVDPFNTGAWVRVGTSIYYTTNSGSTWTQTSTINGSKGHVAIGSNGGVLLHCPDGTSTSYRSTDKGTTWTSVSGLSTTDASFYADPVVVNKFYSYDASSGAIKVSTDGGATFASAGSTLSNGSKILGIAPGLSGDIWVALFYGGLSHTTDAGKTYTTINNITYCGAVGLGKAASGSTYPTVYIWATINSVTGLYRSTDQGATWTRINDDAHEWGGPGNGQFVVGDNNVYGRVYMSTAGRGIVYIDSDVTTVTVTGVSVSPLSVTIAAGSTTTLTATVTPTNATNKAVTWSSSNTAIASVNSAGVVAGSSSGTVTVTAKTVDGDYTAISTVSVTGTVVNPTSVTVSPASTSVYVGSTVTLTATVLPTNATNKNVTWSSANKAIATVTTAGVVTGIGTGAVTITATTVSGGLIASATVTVNPVAVTGISLSPTSVTVGVAKTTSLSATVLPTNATNKSVTWISSNTSVATVSSAGLVTGVAKGSATITATAVDGAKTATSVIIVESLFIPCSNPVTTTLPISQDGAGEYCWSTTGTITNVNSWNTDIVEINGTVLTNTYASTMPETINGNYYIHYKASVSWAHLSVNGSSSIVSVTGVSVTPTTSSVTVGGTASLTATITPTNATNKSVTWSSSNTAIATVSTAGVVTGVGTGSATITVTTVDQSKTATSIITVSSSSTSVTGVTVSPTTASVTVGSTTALTATVTPTNATNKSVTWSSSNTGIATVSTAGIVTGVGTGSATITVTTVDQSKTATATITVSSSSISVTGVSVSPATASVTVGSTTTLTATVTPTNATNKSVTWSSSNTAIASVNTAGIVTGVGTGSATITVTTVDQSKTATATITVSSSSTSVTGVTVSPTTASVSVGSTTTLLATVTPTNATNKSVTWSSSNTAVASVNTAGVVSGVGTGSATITVTTVDQSKTATATITVSSSSISVTGVSVSPTSVTLCVGSSATLTATVTPTNATNKSVIWSSGNTAVAIISNGIITGISAGTTTVTLTTVDQSKTVTIPVTVSACTTVCSNPVAITIPFSQNGAGEYCWSTTQEIGYVNSWNMDKVTINDVDYTNKWSNTMPAAINGIWYIYYKGSYAWSHFEAPALKGASIIETTGSNDVKVYPNPFTDMITVESELTIRQIELYNSVGQLIKKVDSDDIYSTVITIDENLSGNQFYLKIITDNQTIVKPVIKN